MASSDPQVFADYAPKVIKVGAVRLSDVKGSATADYAEVIVGDGVPSGAYGRASGTSMVYIRKDTSSVDTVLYVTPDGGTTWNAVESTALTAALLASTSNGEGASLIGIEDAGALITAATVEGALAENRTAIDALEVMVDSDRNVVATIAVADASGGATDSALTVSLTDPGGTDISAARQVMVYASTSQYNHFASISSTLTFGTATTGSIIASGNGWALVQTDAAGDFACTATNSADETLYFAVDVPAAGVSDPTKGVAAVISNSDAATWSA